MRRVRLGVKLLDEGVMGLAAMRPFCVVLRSLLVSVSFAHYRRPLVWFSEQIWGKARANNNNNNNNNIQLLAIG
ncbi:MAG: hypothetical protein H0W69_09355 [Gemmatimonadaceae bacterium]|nr:hypothetical protein [Gemmatimonadaceae bacterium]